MHISTVGDIAPNPSPYTPPLGEIITVAHTKGGAGKTTLTFNLAYSLAGCGARVLVVDLDQQTGQSAFIGDHEVGSQRDVGAVLLGQASLDDAVIVAVHPNLDVLPADELSIGAAGEQIDDLDVSERFHDLFDEARKRWDIVLVDTAGYQSRLVSAALRRSNGVIVPMVPEAGPVTELPTILNTIRAAAESYQQPEVYGVIKLRIWGSSVYRRVAEEQIKTITDEYGVPLFRNKVPEDARFGEAHLVGLPVGAYQASARSAVAYRHVAYELIQLRDWHFAVPDGL
ncbi:MAG: ParA family protein [Actinobacteria bacterium]|nr:ParA family protein [Actinomycetota bacterium]